MLERLSTHVSNFSFATLIGGSSLAQQRTELYKKPDCIVATTGRLLDHLQNTQSFSIEELDYLVLDEADKLLEMGFKEELLKILEFSKKKTRQTVMVSATLNQVIKELAEITLNKPLTFSVSQQQNTTSESKLKLK
jgi:ATP-dependent RNA helicase DDX27